MGDKQSGQLRYTDRRATSPRQGYSWLECGTPAWAACSVHAPVICLPLFAGLHIDYTRSAPIEYSPITAKACADIETRPSPARIPVPPSAPFPILSIQLPVSGSNGSQRYADIV
jgi:hypothetical protein